MRVETVVRWSSYSGHFVKCGPDEDAVVHVVTAVFRGAIAEHGGPVGIHELMQIVDSLVQLPNAVLPPEAKRHLAIQDQRSVI